MLNNMNNSQIIIFTDLDGSLLDHYDYNHRAADELLILLAQQNIPVIPTSSKTRLELEAFRVEISNTDPFIAENGAAIFIPENYFLQQPHAAKKRDQYWVKEFSENRKHWQNILKNTCSDYANM